MRARHLSTFLVILDCNQFESFEDYIASLSKSARQEYRLVMEKNKDLTYKQVPFDKDKVKGYMELWARQKVRGNSIEWAYPVEWLEDKEKLVFATEISMHVILREDGYWQCEPPMYDKDTDRHLGTYMWFSLILWAIENKLGILNFGGGADNWREMIKTRDQYPNPKYKWRFIPKWVKDNPDLQPNYIFDGTNRRIYIADS